MLEFGTKLWSRMRDGPPGVGTPLSAKYFNGIWERIDLRIHGLESVKIAWDAAVADLTSFGLKRIDDFLAPAFERVTRIAELGFLIAHSATSETLVLDEVSTFLIDDPDERELFHPSAFVTIARTGNQTDFAIGQVASYVRATGILDVTIRQVFGAPGPHADWEISTGSGVPLLMRQQLVDAATARDLARDWAEKAVDADVSGAGTRSAKHHAAKASGYAQDAKDARDVTNAAAILIAGGPVSSVNGKVGAVALGPSDVGAVSVAEGNAIYAAISALSVTSANADNALDLAKAPKDSPTFTGTVSLPNGLQVGASTVVDALKRSARTSNTPLAKTTHGTLIDITSGTFTQTFDPAAALGNGWWVRIRNAGTGDITLDPNGSETIDGLTTFVMYPGEIRDVQCDGASLYSTVVRPFQKDFTTSATFYKPPGYRTFGGEVWAAGGSGAKDSFATGGGGGACAPFLLPASALSSAESVVIGSGGAPVTIGGTNGQAGGLSSFAGIVAYGGGAGFISGSGGAGGNSYSTNFSGSNPTVVGAPIGTNVGSLYGGGSCPNSTPGRSMTVWGGAAGGTVSSGTVYPPGETVMGGKGGVAGTTTNGADGQAPGGGGGATTSGAQTGAGARGEVRVRGVI